MERMAKKVWNGKGLLMDNRAIFFGSKSVYYDENAKIQQNVVEETIKFADENISQLETGLWLDLGSGTGLIHKKSNKKLNIVSLDISYLTLLKSENPICCDFDNLSFIDNSFDKIISCSALQWSKNLENAAKNFYNALKTDGKLIIAVFGSGTLGNLQFLQKEFGIKSLVSFYKQEYLEDILQKAEFSVVAKKEKIFFQKFDNAYSALKNISKIGATNHGGKILSPKKLKDFVREYENSFAENEIIHNYRTFFYISEKR